MEKEAQQYHLRIRRYRTQKVKIWVLYNFLHCVTSLLGGISTQPLFQIEQRLEPLESINLDLSEDLKNEETIVPKDFQATAQKTQEK